MGFQNSARPRDLGASTVWEILQKAAIDPAPQRTNQSWPAFLKAQASAIVATDLFHIGPVFLWHWFVLFFIDHSPRRVHIAGVTPHPTGPTLPQVPRMNAIAERWIGSCRREATDHILITGERHLRLVVGEYAKHDHGRVLRARLRTPRPRRRPRRGTRRTCRRPRQAKAT
ncbi:hypothetical protein [Streptomyces sp. NPDC094472]|uniref:hypothetical protein n=1 Tax=Streptomyces sp. NPDC094472 TaxID=3155080 RepID=UPI00331F4C1F